MCILTPICLYFPFGRCNFLNFARNIKCLRCDGLFEERLRQLREDQDHLPLKKGNWICDRFYFFSFVLVSNVVFLPRGDFQFLHMQLLESCKEYKMSAMQSEASKTTSQPPGNGNVNREFSPAINFPSILQSLNLTAMFNIVLCKI